MTRFYVIGKADIDIRKSITGRTPEWNTRTKREGKERGGEFGTFRNATPSENPRRERREEERKKEEEEEERRRGRKKESKNKKQKARRLNGRDDDRLGQ